VNHYMNVTYFHYLNSFIKWCDNRFLREDRFGRLHSVPYFFDRFELDYLFKSANSFAI
jgi:hypothetical protein